MFRFYQTLNLNSEIERELLRASHLAQLLIDEFDLFIISKSLLETVSKGINVELVIVSTTNNKSMKLVNLCKRLVDQDVTIYWKVDKTLFAKEDYFAIFDKQYLVCGRKQAEFESPEKLLRLKNDFFNGLSITAKKLNLLAGEIDINFNVDKSIVFSNDTITLNWDIKNAYEISINPIIGKVKTKGTNSLIIKKDTKFMLLAKNKDNTVKKSVFVRVIKEKEIGFTLEVYDQILNDYITIRASSYDSGLYAAYFNQKIKISWNISMIGKLIESKIGNLPLSGCHNFVLTQNESFFFTFKSINKNQTKKISFHCFNDDRVFNQKDKKQSFSFAKKDKIISLSNLKKSLLNILAFAEKLFNIFRKKLSE